MVMSERRVGTGSLASTRVYIPWNTGVHRRQFHGRFRFRPRSHHLRFIFGIWSYRHYGLMKFRLLFPCAVLLS
jgi:hypothetical protein